MLSIIVTCYNVRPFILNALASIVAIEGIEMEVIVIDDGSSDGTFELVEEYAAAHREIRFVLHRFEDNTPGGVATAANYGLSIATGEYVAFLDGDDWLYSRAFEDTFHRLKTAPALDFILVASNEFGQRSGAFGFYPDSGVFATFNQVGHKQAIQRYFIKKALKRVVRRAWLRTLLPRRFVERVNNSNTFQFRHLSLGTLFSQRYFYHSERARLGRRKLVLESAPFPWRKIYRKAFLDTFSLRFPEGDWMFEDNPFHWEVVLCARDFEVYDRVVYSHRIWSGQTISNRNDKCLVIFDHGERILDHLHRHEALADFEREFANWVLRHLVWAHERVTPASRPQVIKRARALLEKAGIDPRAALSRQAEAPEAMRRLVSRM